MKKIILSLLVLVVLCTSLYALNYGVGENHTKIINVKGSKGILYDKSIEWLALSATDSKRIIQIQDRRSGKIIAKGTVFFRYILARCTAHVTLRIDIKNNKVRVSVKVTSISGPSGSRVGALTPVVLKRLQNKLKAIPADLTTHLNKSVDNSW